VSTSTPAPLPRASALIDGAALVGRSFRIITRRPEAVISAVIFPLVFALLFLAVFGRVMERQGFVYEQYLLPAIVIQATIFGAIGASILASEDAQGGMCHRLRSMPISRTAAVVAPLGGELIRTVISLAVLIAAGYAMGFRFERGVGLALVFVVVALGCTVAFGLGYLVLGYALGKVEPVRAIAMLVYYPLLLVSSLFVPARAFPDWLQPFVDQQPLSRVSDALRALSTSGTQDVGETVLIAVAWLVGLTVCFALLAPRAFGRSR